MSQGPKKFEVELYCSTTNTFFLLFMNILCKYTKSSCIFLCFRSSTFTRYGVDVRAYICFKLVKVTTFQYYYYEDSGRSFLFCYEKIIHCQKLGRLQTPLIQSYSFALANMHFKQNVQNLGISYSIVQINIWIDYFNSIASFSDRVFD